MGEVLGPARKEAELRSGLARKKLSWFVEVKGGWSKWRRPESSVCGSEEKNLVRLAQAGRRGAWCSCLPEQV